MAKETEGGSFIIEGQKLSNGLRPSRRMQRDSGYLTECIGMVGRDGTLQSLDQLTRITTTAITDGFPYPQIFVFTNLIIVCGATKIYEWNGSLSAAKITVTAGTTWSAVDFYDYVYMSNGKVAVIRSASDKTYSETTDYPTATGMCNYNGQVIVGAPDVAWSS